MRLTIYPMKKTLLLLLILALHHHVNACINEYTIDAHGEKHFTEYDEFYFEPFDAKTIINRLKEIEHSLNQQYDFKLHSDYGANLLKLGCTPEALQVFTALIQKYPNQYSIAANLGTAYELSGKNDSALKYIKRGVELNPSSHFNSEWVHIKILEAKLNKYTPEQLANADILKLGSVPPKKIEQKLRQVYYQLHERMPFTPLGDALLAKVIYETAQHTSESFSLERGILFYNIAAIYNPSLKEDAAKKIARNKQLQKRYKVKEKNTHHKIFDIAILQKHRPLKGNYNYKVYKVG